MARLRSMTSWHFWAVEAETFQTQQSWLQQQQKHVPFGCQSSQGPFQTLGLFRWS
eukprot:CAMPEP_0115303688 /NCGR_PEP_ID=MMETSP0270-20121206/71052_1 /TAXON_ID=71861 /ORGANISM="Scrippsiella trochoidea, Strain CCMP3099" /LENGTH=54 /DNA_ID=CAMNT_0002721703 /DNA_START=303 /DNA_END=464 /DNA_ORIENTATION=+